VDRACPRNEVERLEDEADLAVADPGQDRLVEAADIDAPGGVEDAELAPGDAVIELEGGEIDARLGVRLATVLEPE